ncbi:MAG: CHAT domain-containing protein [Pseudomonadales bacterium]|nr:CHAT domain-containing protein [Pseudomonadales bacterium]
MLYGAWMYFTRTALLTLVFTIAGCASGVPQVIILSGSGQFDSLIDLVEQQYGSATAAPPLQGVQACYAYYEVRRYEKFRECSEFFLNDPDPSYEFYPGEPQTRQNASEVKGILESYRARMYFDFLQFDAAIAAADRSLSLVKQADSDARLPYNVIPALEVKALALINLGQTADVPAIIDEIDRQRIHLPVAMSELARIRQRAIGKIYFAMGDYAAARAALEEQVFDIFGGLVKAPALIFRDLDRGADTMATFNALPRIFMLNKAMMETGDTEKAKAGYDALLSNPVAEQFGDFYWIALSDRAKLHWQDNEPDEAIEKLERAIDIIESQRSSIQSEAFKIGFVGDKQQVYGQIVDYLLARHQYAKAFGYAERAKSRALVDLLAGKQQFGKASRLGGQSLEDLSRIEESLAAVGPASQRSNATRTRGLALAAARDTNQTDPAFSSLVTVTAAPTQALQANLEKGQVLLEYFGSRHWLYTFVISRGQVFATRSTIDGLADEVSRFRHAILDVKSDNWRAISQDLYAKLIEPVADRLSSDELIIVPHGALHYLPFSALHDGSHFLVEQYRYRVLPSASVMRYIKNGAATRSEPTLLALGNPDLGDPRFDLPGAEREVDAIGRIVPSSRVAVRREASETLLRENIAHARFIHIASHGEFNTAHPLDSRLLLAPDSANDGNLTADELYDLDLNAEMVVLSACQTGLGDVQSGDDVIGLTRGLLYAGASNIVASLWVVDDDATSMLMSELYAQLAHTDKQTALQRAQLRVMHEYNAHPFFWAAFQLTGSG